MSSEINKLRVFKRNGPRYISKSTWQYDEGLKEYTEINDQVFNPLYIELRFANMHVPMKKESREIRKIMSKTGLDENEIRDKELYRKQIANAIKNDEIISKEDKLFLRLMKKNGNILQKPIWDDSVVQATMSQLEAIVDEYLLDNPVCIYYYECCNERHIQTLTIEEYLLSGKELFSEAKLLKALYGMNHNSIVKKYMILSKIVKKKV